MRSAVEGVRVTCDDTHVRGDPRMGENLERHVLRSARVASRQAPAVKALEADAFAEGWKLGRGSER